VNNYAEGQDVRGLLREAYQAPSPDAAFVRRLGERLAEELAERPARMSRPAGRWRRIAVPAAAAVVLIAVGVSFLRQPGDAVRSQGDRKVAYASAGRQDKKSLEPGNDVFFSHFDMAPMRPPLIKQPAYQSKTPGYAVLAFGPKADARLWLVFDGVPDPLKPGKAHDFLYVDRNGNGDLTEPGERVEAVVRKRKVGVSFKPYSYGEPLLEFDVGDVAGPDGKVRYKGVKVVVGWFVGGQRYREVTLTANVPGRGTESVSSPLLRPADKPADAPVIHFDGPLALRLNMSNGVLHCPVDYTGEKEPAAPWYEESPLVRGKECDLTAEIGTPGVGPGTFALMTANIPPSNVHPVAEVEFRRRDPAKPAIRVKVELTQRCCGTLFKGKVCVPEDAATGKAKVTLSFPGWADGNVAPTDAEVTVVDARASNGDAIQP
jgi:hypothetical protein